MNLPRCANDSSRCGFVPCKTFHKYPQELLSKEQWRPMRGETPPTWEADRAITAVWLRKLLDGHLVVPRVNYRATVHPPFLALCILPCVRFATELAGTCCTWRSGRIGRDRRPCIYRIRRSDTDSCPRRRTDCTQDTCTCRTDNGNFGTWLVRAGGCRRGRISIPSPLSCLPCAPPARRDKTGMCTPCCSRESAIKYGHVRDISLMNVTGEARRLVEQ